MTSGSNVDLFGHLVNQGRRNRGRPPHEPTPELRRKVLSMRAAGASYPKICAAIGISEPTLVLHYGVELGSRSRRLAPSSINNRKDHPVERPCDEAAAVQKQIGEFLNGLIVAGVPTNTWATGTIVAAVDRLLLDQGTERAAAYLQGMADYVRATGEDRRAELIQRAGGGRA